MSEGQRHIKRAARALMLATNTKKRNPQDATFRNIRALKARVQRLEGSRVLWELKLAQLAINVCALQKRKA